MPTVKKLREAFGADPCRTHREKCPIPPKKGKEDRECQWGHGALEFAEQCDHCARKFLDALRRPTSFAQRLHHSKSR